MVKNHTVLHIMAVLNSTDTKLTTYKMIQYLRTWETRHIDSISLRLSFSLLFSKDKEHYLFGYDNHCYLNVSNMLGNALYKHMN